jgi:hypothetical protein
MSGISANPKSARRMIDSPLRSTCTNRDLGQECERPYGARRSSIRIWLRAKRSWRSLPLMPEAKALAARASGTRRDRDIYFAGDRRHEGFEVIAFRAFESPRIETRSFRLDDPQ